MNECGRRASDSHKGEAMTEDQAPRTYPSEIPTGPITRINRATDRLEFWWIDSWDGHKTATFVGCISMEAIQSQPGAECWFYRECMNAILAGPIGMMLPEEGIE